MNNILKPKIYLPEDSEEILEIIEEDKDLIHDFKIEDGHLYLKDFFATLSEFQQKIIKKYNLVINFQNVLFKSFWLLKNNYVDSILVGHIFSSKDVFLYAILFFGEENFLSTGFLAKLKNNLTIWTDCALNINPDAEMLAKIINNATNFGSKLKMIPQIACISYATYNSASGASVDLVNSAIKIYQKDFNKNKLIIEGPLQFDAAINFHVFNKKTKQDLKKPFNVLVFNNLDTANTAYKIANQLAKIKFYGAFILGTKNIMVDLSRSATKNEIKKIIWYIKKMWTKNLIL